ncbi:MAG: methyltransferase domain-containing protein [Candidatus Omnitrophica bacterium]|nr:methyltransferase domain-containing protein [Candidatus Omnitrophota bacterium]
MSFYDFQYASSTCGKIGKWILQKQHAYIRKRIWSLLYNKETINALEIGPGKSYYNFKAIHRKKLLYKAIEINSCNIEDIEKKIMIEKRGEAFSIPEENEKYDVIFLVESLEHMSSSHEAFCFLKEANRVLKKEGLILVVSPDMCEQGMDFYVSDYSHNYPVTLARLDQLFWDTHFEMFSGSYIAGPFTQTFCAIMSSKIIKLIYWLQIPYLFCFDIQRKIRVAKTKSFLLRKVVAIAQKKE